MSDRIMNGTVLRAEVSEVAIKGVQQTLAVVTLKLLCC